MCPDGHTFVALIYPIILCHACHPPPQAAGVPQFLRLLKSDSVELVTSAAGALHALVQGNGQKAYVPWVGDRHTHRHVLAHP
jgi:hypothetical protein